MPPPSHAIREGRRSRNFQTLFLTSPSVRIGGGTAEIQRDIVAEPILGLPPEPRVDKGAGRS